MKKNKLILSSVLMVCTILLIACNNGEVMQTFVAEETSVSAEEKSTEEGTTIEEATAEETTTEETIKEYIPVTMAFTGDIYLSDKLYGYYMESGVEGFLSKNIADIFCSTDIMVCNHEYASTDLPDSYKDTRQWFNFKSPTSYEVIWKELGVDIVTLANNHAMDYGEQSLLDTMDALDAQEIAYVGAGKNLDEAKSAEIRYVNGKKIAILAASRFILDGDWYAAENKPGVMTTYESTDRFAMMKEEIVRLKEDEKCDIVAVFVHFGKEKSYDILENQKTIAHGYIDAGADFVIGSHAHNLQGIEIYKGAPIYYNLGNFLFGNYEVDTMIVNIKINEDNTVESSIVPCKSKQYKVREAVGQEEREIYDLMESISVNVSIDENGNVTEK